MRIKRSPNLLNAYFWIAHQLKQLIGRPMMAPQLSLEPIADFALLSLIEEPHQLP
ncbi:MAG: hypothetical protein AAFP89_20960 [Bacteroidota bacterium]